MTPDRIGLQYRLLPVETPDGVTLNGWLLPGKPPVKGTIVFLHGNAQNISYHIASVYWLPAAHYNVYLYDYRGFGSSGGKATLENSIQDFSSVMKGLQKIIPHAEQHYIVFGQSLGAAIAIAAVARFKAQFPIQLLVADSAFSGFRRIAKEKLKEILFTRPFAGLLAHAFPAEPDLLQCVAKLTPIPVLLIHGEQDRIVPFQHSRQLFWAAREPKQLWLEPGAGHIMSLTHKPLRRRFLKYLDKVMMQGVTR